MFQRLHVLALQTASVAEPQPRFDAAFICLRAVVVDDAENPLPALISVRHVRKDRCVLQGDADLVVKTVVHPALNLRFGALAAVHCYMERMVDVVAGSLRTQLLLKLFFSPGKLYWSTHDCLLRASQISNPKSEIIRNRKLDGQGLGSRGFDSPIVPIRA